jgi:hypothetical protein
MWRREIARLAESVVQYRVLLTEAGMDIQQLHQAMTPYLDAATAP